jgi:phosphatidylglycerophosphatase A
METLQLKTLVEWLATWFGLGRMPWVPGTFGTLGAFPLVYAFALLGPLPYMISTIVFIVFAVIIAHLFESLHGEHDSSCIVIDEVAGFLVTMTWVPLEPKYWLAGFLLFRGFDMVKPFPINILDQRIKGGLGTVIDDVAAGLVSNIILQFWLGRF